MLKTAKIAVTASADQPLSNDFAAVLITIHQEPKYRFLQNEYRLAERMVVAGLLTPLENRQYAITPYGEECYKKDKLLAKTE